MLGAGADGGIDDFLPVGGVGDGPFVEGAEGPVGDRVKQRGGDFGGGFGGLEEVNVSAGGRCGSRRSAYFQ